MAGAIAAVLLNWITTGDHLARSLFHHLFWGVAGMDVLLLLGAFLAALAARRQGGNLQAAGGMGRK